jgi:uncharacterized protein
MNPLRKRSWSPFVAGAGIGVVETFALATADQPLGITSVFEDAAAVLTRRIAPARYEKYVNARGQTPRLGWQAALVAGVALGSYIASRASGDRGHPAVPQLWQARFGPSHATRYGAAFAGGALMMVGARMARGCTSGHSISGMLGFSASSGLFSLIMGATGAAFARVLYGKEERR